MVELWNTRLSWASEIPTDYPALNVAALCRGDSHPDSTYYADAVDESRTWQIRDVSDGDWWGSTSSGPRGPRLQINGRDPAEEQNRLALDYFSGLWPESGRLLVGLWAEQTYAMDFCPLIDTRSSDPFIYLSTGPTGQPRHQVYDASGSIVLDQWETGLPWEMTSEPYFLGIMVDAEDRTSTMFSVHSDGRTHTFPARSLDGAPNFGAAADVEVFSLRSDGYFEAGLVDEVTIAHPGDGFDLDDFVDALGRSTWADGNEWPEMRDEVDITDSRIEWTSSASTWTTGAERLSWAGGRPSVSRIASAAGSSAHREISYDDGETWEQVSAGSFPEEAEGVLWRWRLETSGAGEFAGFEVTLPEVEDEEVTPEEPEHDSDENTVTTPEIEGVTYSPSGTIAVPENGELTVTATADEGYTFPADAVTSWTYEHHQPDPPTLEALADVVLEQAGQHVEPLEFTADAYPHEFSVSGPSVVSADVVDDELVISAGLDTGGGTVTVTLTDGLGRSVSESLTVRVNARAWEEGPPPQYPNAPIILWGEDEPEELLTDPLEAPITKEINGADTFEFTIPANHRHRDLIQPERRIDVAGERYWIRRITTERSDEGLTIEVYAEARFYELSTAGQVDAESFDQVAPGAVMEIALEGTEWAVDVVNVTTRRDYEIENSSPLEVLRTVQEQHGGDLIFNNDEKTVSLVTRSGRESGVAFFYGRGLSDAKRVVDTTSLVTRIIPRNAEGLGIESVNGGVSYVEDFSFTDEVRTAVYDFDSGASPNTMLSMATATLEDRCKPEYSYEVTVSDFSAISGEDIDRFDVGDTVTVVDDELGIEDTQRIVRLEYDVTRPWASEITLSSRLRETGSGSDTDAGDLTTGADVSSFDLVPFNLLLNSRFDNDLAHWAHQGAEVVESEQGTGDYAVRFAGSGERWIEQTVTPDNREAYAFSFNVDTSGEAGFEPDLTVEAEIEYEDGETETIELDIA